MKRLIYNIIKFPLIFIFLKTPLINILKYRFKYYRFRKKNIFYLLLDTLFEREYFNKLKNKDEIRELTNSTLEDGEGRKWAKYYYEKHFQTLDILKKRRTGTISSNEATPIFQKMVDFIQQYSDSDNTYIIQLGSSSGRDLEFFLKIFNRLNYISTDVNDEILNFQQEKYNYRNLQYYKCYAENIDECIDYFKISKKNIIIFSVSSLQYVNPLFLNDFFSKLKKFNNINLFICEPVSLSFLNNKKLMNSHRDNISFSHRYDELAKRLDFKIIEKKIITPFSVDDKVHGDTGNFYLHLSKNSI